MAGRGARMHAGFLYALFALLFAAKSSGTNITVNTLGTNATANSTDVETLCNSTRVFLLDQMHNATLHSLNATANGTLDAGHADALRALIEHKYLSFLSTTSSNCTQDMADAVVLEREAALFTYALMAHPLFANLYNIPANQSAVVHVTVRLNVSESAFDNHTRQQYRQGVAAACQVHMSAVRITAVRSVGMQRRLLQASSDGLLEVDTEITSASEHVAAVVDALGSEGALGAHVGGAMGVALVVQISAPPTVHTLTTAASPETNATGAQQSTPTKTTVQTMRLHVVQKRRVRMRMWIIPIICILVLAITTAVLFSLQYTRHAFYAVRKKDTEQMQPLVICDYDVAMSDYPSEP